jgi:DNA-binding transcriptional ArsR family regulator
LISFLIEGSVAENKADVIFHPVRMRIVQSLFGDRRLTAQQIAAVLDGPSIATLYRHLNRLVDAEVIAVVEERPVRGTLEKVYALANDQAASFSADEVRQSSPDEQKHNFSILLGTLLGDYERYLDQPGFDPPEDGVMIRQKALNLTDDEARALSSALKAAFAPYIANPLEGSRRRRMLTMLLLPIVEPITPPLEEAPD